LILTSLLEGVGLAEKKALSARKEVEIAAASWAWLNAAGRARGKEWKFDRVTIDRGGGWIVAAQNLLDAGKALIQGEEADYKLALERLHKATGQQQPLP
jgi:hypothetical protein